MTEKTEFETLATAAYKGERVAARRLAAESAMAPADALRQVLTLAAGAAGLAALLAERARLRQRDEERRAGKARLRAERQASRQRPVEGYAWRGWFDGSATPNPGRIGIGALLCGPDGERITISRGAGHGNSGEAEYLALTALLEAALAAGATALLVQGDSQVVINDAGLAAGARGAAGLEAHRLRVAALLERLGAVSLRWVPRHRNGEADLLSQLAVKAEAEQAPGPP